MATLRTTVRKTKTPKKDVKALHRRICKRGRMIDSGAVATVYRFPNQQGKVLKVSNDSDIGYYRYLKWCVKNQHNPFVPKIFRAHFFENPRTEEYYTVVLMEALKEVAYDYSSHKYQVASAVRSHIQYGREEVFSYIRNKTARKHLASIRNAVKRISRSRKIRIDLHNENVMMRGGQVVVTDPVVDNNV